MITWTRKSAEERGREYTDHVSTTSYKGRVPLFRAAEGYDEPARLERGENWTLFVAGKHYRTFRTLAEAKRAATTLNSSTTDLAAWFGGAP